MSSVPLSFQTRHCLGTFFLLAQKLHPNMPLRCSSSEPASGDVISAIGSTFSFFPAHFAFPLGKTYPFLALQHPDLCYQSDFKGCAVLTACAYPSQVVGV